jgi:hypothetical protein
MFCMAAVEIVISACAGAEIAIAAKAANAVRLLIISPGRNIEGETLRAP